ncbi:HetZ-related protein 2 [Microcoleus sp. FACHB-1515]|uniref:HetZ-related protein 2 n=1 Tax=Cyanophyceae TaxID=3028117 RepID=UPI0016865A38|nr:HetZ-related protein 2 [Microcoleus sp. FACHB-1515]MBD2090582.1 HetZ-related protein 2 [Microcoleus sp. FACHB-1515]
MPLMQDITQDWQARLAADCPGQSATQTGILRWLIGEDPDRFSDLDATGLAIAQQAMDYRYRILQERYLRAAPEQAYQKLLQRLGSLFLIRNKIRTGVALSRDRHRSVKEVLQEVIQELIQSDNYIRQQMQWIAQCSPNPRLRNALMLASIEEYCLRPIRNQPLLVYRFVNYLKRSQRGGMTQVPGGESVRLVSEEIAPDDADNAFSLLDPQAIAQYQEEQALQEQQTLRTTVKNEFSAYLESEVEPDAARWLELHLQGQSQEAIAKLLDRPIGEVYRLREKISYHAMRVFGLKHQPDMVMSWLGTSLEQNLGLTPTEADRFRHTLTPDDRTLFDHLIEGRKAGKSMEAIAKELNLKTNSLTSKFIKLYLAVQEFRNAA